PTIPQLLLDTIERHGSSEAVVWEDTRLTYDELGAAVFRLAEALLDLEVGSGDRIALWLPNYPEWIITNLAAACIGAVTVPVNARFRAQEAAYVLQESAASVIITTASFLSNSYVSMLESILGPMWSPE